MLYSKDTTAMVSLSLNGFIKHLELKLLHIYPEKSIWTFEHTILCLPGLIAFRDLPPSILQKPTLHWYFLLLTSYISVSISNRHLDLLCWSPLLLFLARSPLDPLWDRDSFSLPSFLFSLYFPICFQHWSDGSTLW